MPTVRDLIYETKKRGGSVVNESSGRWTVYQVEPPAGFLWDGELSAFRVQWQAPDPEDKQAALTDAIERVRGAVLVPYADCPESVLHCLGIDRQGDPLPRVGQYVNFPGVPPGTER